MKIVKATFLFLMLVFVTGKANSPGKQRDAIDIVFCLDLSGSTNGLIDDVRERLWEIVNQVNSYRPAPKFRIGVVGFSRPSFGAKNAYVKVLQDLTDDFDLLCFELYKLKPSIEKGDQIVGEALKVSIKNMTWTSDDNSLKVIYLVGNGMVNSGRNDYRAACELAVSNNIIVNTVYCRTINNYQKELPGWREIARLSNGEQFDIKIHKRTPIVLSSPDPEEFKTIASDFSSTYIYFGENGSERHRMMAENDRAAMVANPMTFESRIFYKISDRYQYHQEKWDLVDYLKMTDPKLESLNTEWLPDSLKFKSAEYILSTVVSLKDKRNKAIIDLRRHLPYDRQAKLNQMLEDRNIHKSDIFERVVINSLNELASSNGFTTGSAANLEFSR